MGKCIAGYSRKCRVASLFWPTLYNNSLLRPTYTMDQLHLFISLLLRESIISKCSLKMSGKVREFDHDWRVATLCMVSLRSTLVRRLSVMFTIRENFQKFPPDTKFLENLQPYWSVTFSSHCNVFCVVHLVTFCFFHVC